MVLCNQRFQKNNGHHRLQYTTGVTTHKYKGTWVYIDSRSPKKLKNSGAETGMFWE